MKAKNLNKKCSLLSFKACLFIFLQTVLLLSTNAQDTLKTFLSSSLPDTEKVNRLNRKARFIVSQGKFNEASVLLGKSEELAKNISFKKGLARAYSTHGVLVSDTANIRLALEYFEKAVKLRQEIKDWEGVATSYTDIGRTFFDQGNYGKALENYYNALKAGERSKNPEYAAFARNNIANTYNSQSSYDKAIEKFLSCVPVFESTNNQHALLAVFNGLGLSYSGIHDYSNAEKYFRAAIEIGIKYEETEWTCNAYNNLGYMFQSQNRWDEALTAHTTALKLCTGKMLPFAEATSHSNIGAVFIEQKKLTEAKRELKKGLAIATAFQAYDMLYQVYGSMVGVDTLLKDYTSAVADLKLCYAFRDSVDSEENTRKTVQSQMQYEFEKKSAQDSVINAEAMKLEELKRTQEISKQKTYKYGVSGGFIIMLMLAGLSYYAFRNKRKSNIEIERQKAVVEEKQREILDSIYYARRIQRALITNEKYIHRKLEQLKKS